MERDDIFRWAREAGFETDPDDVWITDGYWLEELERFAAIVEKTAKDEEREACAQVCDDVGGTEAAACANVIRARGEK